MDVMERDAVVFPQPQPCCVVVDAPSASFAALPLTSGFRNIDNP
jgi:hypothetical protein